MTTQTLRTAGVAAARDYQDLPAWQKSLALAEKIHVATEGFPLREHAGLAAFMRAKAIEIPASIAAASGRNNEFGMNDSYSKAQSATAELTTLLALASRLDYLDAVVASRAAADIEEISRLIVALKNGLKVAARDEKRTREENEKHERQVSERQRDFKKRDFKKRDGDDRPRRDFKKREERGDRGDRPYRDKKPYGDRKPYGDKKPYGDRKPRGDKPFRKPRD